MAVDNGYLITMISFMYHLGKDICPVIQTKANLGVAVKVFGRWN